VDLEQDKQDVLTHQHLHQDSLEIHHQQTHHKEMMEVVT
jgi:hypothetical protein